MKKNSVLFKTASGIFMSSMHSEIDLETYRTRKAVYDMELVQAKMFMLSLLHRQSR